MHNSCCVCGWGFLSIVSGFGMLLILFRVVRFAHRIESNRIETGTTPITAECRRCGAKTTSTCLCCCCCWCWRRCRAQPKARRVPVAANCADGCGRASRPAPVWNGRAHGPAPRPRTCCPGWSVRGSVTCWRRRRHCDWQPHSCARTKCYMQIDEIPQMPTKRIPQRPPPSHLPGHCARLRSRRIAIVVGAVPVAQTEIVPAHGARDGYHFLLFAQLVRALVGEDFRLVRLAVLVNVLANGHVGRNAARRWHRFAAQRTRRHLDVLFVRGRAVVLLVAEVAGTVESVRECWNRWNVLVFHTTQSDRCYYQLVICTTINHANHLTIAAQHTQSECVH